MVDLAPRVLLVGLSACAFLLACPETETSPPTSDVPLDAVTDASVAPDAPEAGPTDTDGDASTEPPGDIYAPVHGCFSLATTTAGETKSLVAEGDGYVWSDAPGTSFRFQAADLGTYLLYDPERAYLAAKEAAVTWILDRPTTLKSAVELLDDTFRSPAEWDLQTAPNRPSRYVLRHRASGLYLAATGLAAQDSAAELVLTAATGCAVFPEMSLDATGQVAPKQWEDGDVYGIAELHSHLNTNSGFGGGGVFHGAPFHRLGVERALPDCDIHHGEEGRRDIVGFFYDGDAGFDIQALLPIISEGQAPEFNHHTDGYPTFTDWPNARDSSTHHTMYYRWLERAYLGGLRLMVELATSNSVLCNLVVATGAQNVRYSCNDMVNIERAIQEAHNMERYIDAQHGGPGKGWFRIVESPQEARDVIHGGKLAIVLGIEVSNLFDCFSTPKEGFDACTPESLDVTLDYYHGLGVRAVFPVHKYDNAFTAGDGSSGIIELGNMLNSGHYSNFVEDCPDIETTFDGGDVTFGGLNEPREEFLASPPIDVTGYEENLLATIFPFLDAVGEPPLQGNWCQNHGMTPLGETLLQKLMDRGMLIDIGHLPKRSLVRGYELLEANEYPATKTHGSTNNNKLYDIGGMRGSHVSRCGDPSKPGGMIEHLLEDVQGRAQAGAYPAEGLSFDLNGFAGGPRARFGPKANCSVEQVNPVTYPFTSHDGAVTFEPPRLGERAVDFNTEGMIHIGLLPELLEDLRRDGATDAQMEPLFRSAEAYLRMWEHAESRSTRVR